MSAIGYRWVSTSTRDALPSTALCGGVDADGSKIYVARAYHGGDILPAKYVPHRHEAYVAFGGAEHHVENFEILCHKEIHWHHSQNGEVPSDAVPSGTTSDGETLYTGRAEHNGTLTIGKVHPSHGVCYIPFDGVEHAHKQYEVLVFH